MHRLLAAMTLGLIAGCGSTDRTAREPAQDEAVLRMLTYNVNYGLAGDEETMEAIREAQADVVVLQETTPAWEDALRPAMSEDYAYMLFRHSGGAGGLAILSRYPVHELDYLPAIDWFPAWRLIVEGPLGPVQVLAVHLRPPISDRGSVVSGYFSTPGIRETEITDFLESLDPELPTVVAGDFNERDGLALAQLEERGFRSAIPEFQSRARTWRWQTRVGEIRTMLDHIAYDQRLMPLNAEVIEAGRSDHFPVLVVFTLADETDETE